LKIKKIALVLSVSVAGCLGYDVLDIEATATAAETQ
jgi:hypothetical protein